MATIVLRNLLGIPLWFTGFVLAWLGPSPSLLNPSPILRLYPLYLGAYRTWLANTHAVCKGYAGATWVVCLCATPHLYGGFFLLAGFALLKPTYSFVSACALGEVWLIIQARLEEIDLLQRMPDYKEYMKQVPRFREHIGSHLL